MNKPLLTAVLFLTGISVLSAQTAIKITNQGFSDRENEIIRIQMINPGLGNVAVYDAGKLLQSEIIKDNQGNAILYIRCTLKPGEVKTLNIINSKAAIPVDGTQAYLGIKTGYEIQDSIYSGGRFVSTDFVAVPTDHFAHDALFQFEGPGWESDKVGYRLYLDDRNRTDIFGKKTNDLILQNVGINDLVSDGKESYQNLQNWGLDLFKVGSSLGIGSVSTIQDEQVITISNYDSVTCKIIDDNLVSSVTINHYGWKLKNKINVQTTYSIKAGRRLTDVEISTDKDLENICTGLAKHTDTEYLNSNVEGWNYIALWGNQTTVKDNLGIAVFYNSKSLIKTGEDNLNYFVILKPLDRKINYYFAAAWEQELDGIKSLNEFKQYLQTELNLLNNPVKIDIVAD